MSIYVWRDRAGKKVTAKEFAQRFAKGVEGITPLQQTKTSLMSFLPIIAGQTWGITVTLMSKTYWLSLILAGSLPLTLIQLLGTWQRYKALKRAEEVMREVKKRK